MSYAERIHKIVAALSHRVTAEEVADATVCEAVEATSARAGAVFLFDGNRLRHVHTVGYPQAILERWGAGEVPPTSVIHHARSGEAAFTASRLADPRFDPALAREFGDGAACIVPLNAGGRAIGGLALSFARVREFESDERDFILTLAGHCAQSLERALLFESERAARRELEGVLDQLPVAAALVRTDGRILVNRQAQQIYRTPIKVTDRKAFPAPEGRLEHIDGRKLVADEVPIVRALRGEVVSGQVLSITNTEKEKRLVRVNAGPVRDEGGRIGAAIAVFTDITDEARIAEELRASERRHRAVLSATSDVIWELDYATRRFWWNDALESVFGYRAEETNQHPEGGFAWWSERVHPEDRDRVVAGFRAAEEAGELAWSGQYRFRCADGSYTPTLDRCVFERDSAGKMVRLVGSMSDVRELHRIMTELRDAVRVRDDFLSIAGHELRTPLAALSAQLLGLQTLPLSDERRAQKLAAAERQTRRLKSLVDQLLDVSRIVDGKLQLAREEVDLSGLVREVVGRLSEDFRRSGTQLDVDASTPVMGRWDRLRIDLVVTNLLTNSLRYGQRRPVSIRVASCDGRARITVEDSGIGIRREDQERIFERFVRAVQSREYGGLGVGLWLARQIVDAHQGSLTVESDEGKGASFTVMLPT